MQRTSNNTNNPDLSSWVFSYLDMIYHNRWGRLEFKRHPELKTEGGSLNVRKPPVFKAVSNQKEK